MGGYTWDVNPSGAFLALLLAVPAASQAPEAGVAPPKDPAVLGGMQLKLGTVNGEPVQDARSVRGREYGDLMAQVVDRRLPVAKRRDAAETIRALVPTDELELRILELLSVLRALRAEGARAEPLRLELLGALNRRLAEVDGRGGPALRPLSVWQAAEETLTGKDGSVSVRIAAIELLARYRCMESGLARLEGAADGKKESKALPAVMSCPDDSKLHVLADAAESDPSPLVRAEALEAIKSVGKPTNRVSGVLSVYMSGADPKLKTLAAEAALKLIAYPGVDVSPLCAAVQGMVYDPNAACGYRTKGTAVLAYCVDVDRLAKQESYRDPVVGVLWGLAEGRSSEAPSCQLSVSQTAASSLDELAALPDIKNGELERWRALRKEEREKRRENKQQGGEQGVGQSDWTDALEAPSGAATKAAQSATPGGHPPRP